MAESSRKKPSPEYRYDPGRGEHIIGVVLDGAFVPFVAVSDATAGQHIERAGNVAEIEASDAEGGE